MVNNFADINDLAALENIFSTMRDRLIMIMYYDSSDANSIRQSRLTPRIASAHQSTYFCTINVSTYREKSKLLTLKASHLQGFYQGKNIGHRTIEKDDDYEKIVTATENFMNSTNIQTNLSPTNQQVHQAPQRMQYNPVLDTRPIYSPNIEQSYTNVHPQSQRTLSPPPQQQIAYANDGTAFFVPSIYQMEYMFKIFKTMQKMGVLLTDTDDITPTDPDASHASIKPEESIVMKNGDEIVPLGNGKYGLVRK